MFDDVKNKLINIKIVNYKYVYYWTKVWWDSNKKHSADDTYYYFAGYNNEEILTLRVDISEGKYIIDMCLCNKINKENDNYLDYYLIRDKYYELRKANTISIKRTSTPYINPYTLEQTTSSDRYLDGYEPTKYSVLIDTRYEDPIVNIIF